MGALLFLASLAVFALSLLTAVAAGGVLEKYDPKRPDEVLARRALGLSIASVIIQIIGLAIFAAALLWRH